MRKALAVSCLFAILILAPTLPVFAGEKAEKPIGKVIAVTGTVEFFSGEAAPVAQAAPGQPQPVSFEPWRKAQFHQEVFARDQFRTLQGSRLKILFEDKSLIALGPNSQLKVESYLYKPEDKLRQGVINMAHGLSMYIVNKSQNNKASTFRIVSPTGNMAARGTHGYISASADATLVANQAGIVDTSNIDPNVPGSEAVGPMMKNVIPKGLPPTPPVPLTHEEVNQIRNFVLAPVGLSSTGKKEGKSLIAVEGEKKDGKKEEKGEKDADKKEEGKESPKKEEKGEKEEKKGESKDKSSEKKGDDKTVKDSGEKTKDPGGRDAQKAEGGLEKTAEGSKPAGPGDKPAVKESSSAPGGSRSSPASSPASSSAGGGSPLGAPPAAAPALSFASAPAPVLALANFTETFSAAALGVAPGGFGTRADFAEVNLPHAVSAQFACK
ncbi:MAG: FecR domain-containing protein [Nitrospinae bacterium]|nr:FecR domain-containing protein [Nitrospinota bacterium]